MERHIGPVEPRPGPVSGHRTRSRREEPAVVDGEWRVRERGEGGQRVGEADTER